MKIFKYAILPGDEPITAPHGAEALAIQVQNGAPQLWALVSPERPTTLYRVWAVGTGHEFPLDAYQAHYLGTFQVSGLVFHVFSDMSLYKQGDQNG